MSFPMQYIRYEMTRKFGSTRGAKEKFETWGTDLDNLTRNRYEVR